MLNNLLLGQTAEQKLYVEDVFSTYLYTGNGSTQYVKNDIALADGATNGTNLHLTGDALTDSSPVAKSLSVSGSVTVNTSIKKYGTGSLYFDGSSKINFTPSISIASLSHDCTIECWIYPTTLSNESVWGFSNAGTGECYLQWFSNALYVKFGNIYTSVAATSAALLNTWTHIAVVRYNDVVTLYINGVGTSLGAVTTNPTAHTYFSVGDGAFNTVIPFDGYIDDLRVSQRAVYTSNFTVPSAALPLDTILSGKGGMVWTKCRLLARNNNIGATVLGTSGANTHRTNQTSALFGDGTQITSFNSNGYTLGLYSESNALNDSFVSWTFRKAPKFFDVVTYTGDGTTPRTLSHSLGVSPGMVIVKATSGTSRWTVWHRSVSPDYFTGYLNTTDAFQNALGSSKPPNLTASTFDVHFASNADYSTNTSGVTYVAYLFAHDTTADGIVQCGSFTTDASGNATVSLGFEPQFVLFKASSTTGSWRMYDNMRGIATGGNDAVLYANLASAEDTASNAIDLNATGFSVSGQTASATYIYLAIRRGPMRTPTDATKVFNPQIYTGDYTTSTPITGMNPGADVWWNARRTPGSGFYDLDRLRGWSFLQTPTSNSENISFTWSQQTQTSLLPSAAWWGSSVSQVSYFFNRAPGFIDVVCYTGTGSPTTISHNLGVVPEMIIQKCRSTARAWRVYHSALGASKAAVLNATTVPDTSTTLYWNNTAPTATVFSVGTSLDTNGPGYTNVAYLFASCPGVSKVGTYTGTGTTNQIDCGFTNGARFVLIKRTDSTGDWYVWDTARGVIAGNDPYLLLNSTAVEVTNTDYIDPLSTGFEISSTAPAAINANGGTYIYLAIA